MLPTILSITELNMANTTIGRSINSFFKQAKASIVPVFSSKLQDIFARSSRAEADPGRGGGAEGAIAPPPPPPPFR